MSKIEIIEIKKKREKPRRERTSSLPKRKKSIDYQTDDDLINCNGDDLIDSLLEDERYDSSSSNSKKELIRNKHRTFRKASYPGSKSDTETKAKSRRHEKSGLRKGTSSYDFSLTSDRDAIEQTSNRDGGFNFDFSNKEILYQIPKLRRLFTPTAAKKRGIFSEYVIYNADKGHYTSISAGTIRDLIEWCSFFPGSASTRNVLLFYRTLYSPEYLLNSILETFCAYELRTPNLSQDILERFYAFIVQWIIYWYPRDFDDQLRRALVQFLGQKITPFNNGQALHHIHYLLRNERPSNHRFGGCPVINPPSHNILSETTKRKYPKLLSPRSFASFPILSPRIKPERFSFYSELKSYSIPSYVQFITVLESSLFDAIELEEFLDKNWQKENKTELAPNLCLLSDHFNNVSLWVGSVILSTSSLRQQIKIMRRFIRISRKLMKIRNYSSTAQIISGLNNISVARLKSIKNGLSEKYQKILENLEEKFNPRDNYKLYRKLPKHPPCLPFLPVYLRDLTVIFDTTATFIDKQNRVISLDKINAVGSIIYNDICIHNKTLTSYYFCVPEVHLDNFKNMLQHALDEDSLYQRSLLLQPMSINSSSSSNISLNFNQNINHDNNDNISNISSILRDIMNDNGMSRSTSSHNIVISEVDSHLDSLT